MQILFFFFSDSLSLLGFNSLKTLEYKAISASKSLKMVFGENSGSINTLQKVITYSDVPDTVQSNLFIHLILTTIL